MTASVENIIFCLPCKTNQNRKLQFITLNLTLNLANNKILKQIFLNLFKDFELKNFIRKNIELNSIK